MSKFKISLTIGLAMFAMFFGYGNLVFPIKIGMHVADKYALASMGLIITGVIVPILGLLSMVVYQGDRVKYFGLLGKWAPFTLTLLMLSLLGPFGVVPRCIIVAYGGISLLWPSLSLIIFSSF
jgi:LIVCS family branched-chain amino acid:cation transporter